MKKMFFVNLLTGLAGSAVEAQTKAVFTGLSNAPQGVTEWSKVVEDMFEVSNNVGPITMEDGKLNVEYLTAPMISK